ncbi:hypothetical protein [Streptomyces virginiae]|uniref:MmyB family transcriptional regulator n=1 Tax=Streptomyces virginiae TaxID=1961 RepID=UPI0036662920
MRVVHPVVGPVDLDCQVLLAQEADQRLALFTPPPGSDTADRLTLLPVLDTERFPSKVG